MTNILSFRVAVCVAVLAGVVLPGLAVAQLPGGTATPMSPGQAKPLVAPKPEIQPAALPGARSAPGARDRMMTRPAGLGPNEALFDAVNRGDIGSAREALSRGASTEVRNVLGLTPVELSVDLGRNDITFLLLSMRGSSGRGSSGRGEPAPVAKPAAASAPRVVVALPPARVAAAVPVRQVLSSDPGVPAPQAGFLGFGRTP